MCREDFREVEKRTLQERVERLLKSFRSEQLQGMKRSGTEEEYDERERLLQDLSDLEKEWTARKRAAPPTAAETRKKASRTHAATVGRAMQERLAAPLQPTATTTAEEGPAEAAPPAQEDEPRPRPNDEAEAAAVNQPDHPPTAEDNADNQRQENGQQRPKAKRLAFSPAARWTSIIDYMREKLERDEEGKKASKDYQREELEMKKRELDIRKLEAENERMRIEAQQREQQRRADLEEERRKEEREDRRLMMDRQNEERKQMIDRQNQLLDAMLQLIQAKK